MTRCAVPFGWHRDNSGACCHAFDDDSGLADPRQRSFSLPTFVGAGSASSSAATHATSVCDRAGNCAVVVPFSALKIDRQAPSVSCDPSGGAGWRASVTVSCRAVDPRWRAGQPSARSR